MGWRYRKSINLGNGMRMNISNSGVGFSYGMDGYRTSIMPNGRIRTTYTLKGTGLSYVEEHTIGSSPKTNSDNQGMYKEYNSFLDSIKSDTAYSHIVDKCNIWLSLEKLTINIFKYSIILSLILYVYSYIKDINPIYFILPIILINVFFLIKYLFNYFNKIKINYIFDNNTEYSKIIDFINTLNKSQQLFHLYGETTGLRARTNAGASTSVSTKQVFIKFKLPRMINSNIQSHYINLNDIELYFFPSMILIIKNFKTYILSYSDIQASYETHNIITNKNIAKETEIIGYCWQYSNNDGTRDKRFNNNYQIPNCKYGQINIKSNSKLDIKILGSNKEHTKKSADLLNEVSDLFKSKNTNQSTDNANAKKVQINKICNILKSSLSGNKNADSDKVSELKNNYKSYLYTYYKKLIDHCKINNIQFRKSNNANDFNSFACIPAFVGKDYIPNTNKSVMIVGRAVNGWDKDWSQDTEEMIKEIFELDFDLNDIKYFPEIDGYCFSKSKFFKVSKEVISKIGLPEEEWSNHIVWTNMYKIAPSVSGNPSGKTQHIQREIAIEILKKEIEYFKPKYILFITGYDFTTWSWYNNKTENTFAKEFDLITTNELGEFVEAYSKYNNSNVIVACRPETKSIEEWVNSVTNAFDKLEMH